MAKRSSEEVLRRKLIATFLFQGVAACLVLVLVAIARAGDTARVLSELGRHGPLLVGIFFALTFALSLFKFKLSEKTFVNLALTSATSMLPLLGPVVSCCIAVAATTITRALGVLQIGPNKTADDDAGLNWARVFGQAGTYGIPVLFAGSVYEAIGGVTPALDSSWGSALRIAIAGASLLFANHIVMDQVEVIYGPSPRDFVRETIIDATIFGLALPYAVLMSLHFGSMGPGAILGWAVIGVVFNLVARNLAVTRGARDRLVHQLASLSNVGRTISIRFTTRELLMAIYEACRKTVDVSFFSIAIHDESSNELVAELDIRDGELLPKFRFPVGTGLNSWVFLNRRPLRLADTVETARMGIVAVDDGKATEGWLGVPMIARDRVIGVISVQSFRKNAFSQDDEILLTTIANQAAVALDNSALFRELSELTGDLENRVLERTNELQETNLRLVAADRSKSQFLAQMSHELRTPLNSIIGFSGVLLGSTRSVLEPRLFKFVENIHEAGEHLLTLINDILDLSKIEAGRLELAPQRFALRQTVEVVERVIRGVGAEAGIRLESHLAPDVPTVNLDEGKVKQILLNLLSNAVKFSHPDSLVGLRIDRLDASASPLGVESVSIRVSDSGIGIPRAELKRIFDQFYQVVSRNVRSRKGTGLGLSLARGLVDLHGGRIGVDSTEGRGSTFTVVLPVDCEIGGDTPGRGSGIPEAVDSQPA
ncbi:MAG: ATP-binding protein [Thermoanaerobaculia bacterium]